jgi:hypothetical protein
MKRLAAIALLSLVSMAGAARAQAPVVQRSAVPPPGSSATAFRCRSRPGTQFAVQGPDRTGENARVGDEAA